MDLIIGANGFIGRRLATSLRSAGRPVRLVSRQARPELGISVCDLLDPAALSDACDGIERVFHCAGFAHAFSSSDENQERHHWQVNCEGTRNLIAAAGAAGARRFVFLSSVKAMAEPREDCVDEDWPGAPATAYGLAKRAAEEAVQEIGQRFGMHTVNLRLAMVYGAGGRGNLERMAALIRRGWFPPLPETGNRRSLVHIADVISAILKVADDGRAAGQTFIVAGAETPSGRMLYDAIRAALGMSACRWSIPQIALRGAARFGDAVQALTGRRIPLDSEAIDRLLGSACYSAGRIQNRLGWTPIVTLHDGLSEMLHTEASHHREESRPC